MRTTYYLMVIALFSSLSVVAATTPITISGTVTAPTCTINQNGPIDIDYGTLNVEEIETSKGVKTTRFPLNCKGTSLRLTLSGTGASFNPDYLQTNINGLGIRFTDENDADIPVNTTVDIDTDITYLDVQTALATKTNAAISGGAFSTTVIFVFEYS